MAPDRRRPPRAIITARVELEGRLDELLHTLRRRHCLNLPYGSRMNEAQLLAEIVARPHELAARSAFADLVGGDRGAFIRAQLASSAALRAEPPGFDDDAVLLAEDLLVGHEVEWAHGVDSLVNSFRYVRGFVEVATVDAAWFTQHWKMLFERAPIRHLVVQGLAQAPGFFECDGLRQLVGLSFNLFGTPAYRERLDDAGALALASSSRLAGLRFLDLSHCPLTESSKVAVLRALPALRACVLDDLIENRLEDSIDGSTLGAMPSDALNAFEVAHGHFEALHEVDRTRSLVLLERY
ncbi:MAG: hypothetical protein Q8N23_23350 [Archangium sp.]|nr:hypothetical protein [Archangium sp.]MDP3570766.1 hypothetical protein [Archangium sp.]